MLNVQLEASSRLSFSPLYKASYHPTVRFVPSSPYAILRDFTNGQPKPTKLPVLRCSGTNIQ